MDFRRSRGATALCVLLFSSTAILAQDIVLQASFDTGVEGFLYVDDPFRGTDAPAYASGAYVSDGGFDGGGLQILLGGLDNVDIFGMSGGWQRGFNLLETGRVTLSFRINLTQAPDYESDELSEGLAGVDGALAGGAVAQVTGNGNGGAPESTGWQFVQVDLGILDAGVHALTLGGYNNKKTFNNESSEILIDSVLVTSQPVSEDVIFAADFDSGADGFSYLDDSFRGTGEPVYASGAQLASGGFSGGALEVLLGGVDNAQILNMSGGWQRTFSLAQATTVTLSLRYRLIQFPDYENDELSQALVSVNGTLVGQPPGDVLAQIAGDGNGGDQQSTGWKLFRSNLGTLNAGSHTLVAGAFNNKKTFNNESTRVLIDDVLLVRDVPSDPGAGARAVVDRLDLQRFTDNIATLAGFGDRTQGSPSYAAAAAWVQAELEAAGYVVERHAYTFGGGQRDSMYVTKVGTTFPDRMFIVSAHLDGRGGGGGADDDGSGSSLVLEVARILAAPDVRTETSVRMIFWNNEETGLNGSRAYASDRVLLQGVETPPGSGLFPEPTWLGIVQHDMILFDHGLPPQQTQIPGADADIEYRASSTFAGQSVLLANALLAGNGNHATDYPAEVGSNMSNTDSVPFQDFAPSVSVRENQRLAEIGNGANPHWHQPTDIFTTYSAEDFLLGFNILQTTLGTVAELAGLEVISSAE